MITSLTSNQAAWAAGLFEGEGCIRTASMGRGRTPHMSVCMTDRDVVVKFRQIVGVGNVNGPYLGKGGRKPAWVWTVTSFEKVQFMVGAFWPWLGQRRRAKACDVLALARSTPVKPSQRTRCKQGHEFTAANILIGIGSTGRPVRRCRACISLANKKYRQDPDVRTRLNVLRREWRHSQKEKVYG